MRQLLRTTSAGLAMAALLSSTGWASDRAAAGAAGDRPLPDDAVLFSELARMDDSVAPERVLDKLADLYAEDTLGGPAEGYVVHRRWGVGGADGFGLDQFSGSSSGTYRGRAAARLSNGEVVVVGEIEGGGIAGERNLGIVKYNRRGQRVAWPDVEPMHALYQNQYIRFPGNDTWTSNRDVIAVHDVAIHNDNLYTLITFSESGLRRAAIIRFTSTGAPGGWWYMAPDSEPVRDAVAMDVYGPHMIVLGRRTINVGDSGGGYWTARITIDGNGSLAVGTVSTFQAGATMTPADVAFARSTVIPATRPAYYVLASSRTLNGGNSVTTVRLSRVDGLDQEEIITGTVTATSWGMHDWAIGLHSHMETYFTGAGYATRDVLYASAIRNQSPADGIAVARYVDGVPDGTFGVRFYGGCSGTAGAGCSGVAALPPTAHVPLRGAIFGDATGVYVAGRTFRESLLPGTAPSRRPVLMHIDGNGQLRSLQSFGSLPNARFAALVPENGSNASGNLTMAGLAHYQDTDDLDGGPTRYMTTHLVRASDHIFYDGLQ